MVNLNLMQRGRAERAGRGRRAPIPVSPPLRGLYAKDDASRASMEYAQVLTNLISDGVVISNRPRSGPTTGFPTDLFQAWPYEFGGQRKAVFRTSTGLANDDGTVTETVSYSGDITADEISARLMFVGGGAAPRLWDGAAFSTPDWTLPVDAPDALTEMTGCLAHHDRIYLWNENSAQTGFYYAEQVAALSPVTFVYFPLGALGNITGRIKAMISLSLDAGHGANDILAIITTTGQMIGYEGLDPGDETDWRLWGRVPGLSETVAQSALVHVGADAYVATRSSIYSLRQTLLEGADAEIQPPSEPIDTEFRASVAAGSGFRGWQMIRDPDGRFVLLNYPTASDAYAQWVYVFDARGWFRWTVPARWWFVRAGELYFIDTSGGVKSFGAADADETDLVMAWWTNWLRLTPRDIPLPTLKVELLAKAGASLGVVCLTNNRATAPAIVENTQTVNLATQDAAGDDFQNLDEIFSINQRGGVVQLRFTLTAQEAKWLGITLNP